MLNLDFERVKNGLIPSKSLFPLYVPLNGLAIERVINRNLLGILPGQGLSIPHSALLDPAGDEWVVSFRVFMHADGLIFSQSNDTQGFVVYMLDGQILARVRTGHSAFLLEERGTSQSYKNQWVTIEVRIRKGMALLSLNRKRVCMATDEPALTGQNLRIRLGDHRERPGFLKDFMDIPPSGFQGAFSSLKILRQ
ncbi:MAG: LamG domain-containing protein [Pontiella sp.]